MLTRKVPGLELVDIDDGDVIVTVESSGHLPFQVEHHEFFIGGVESKARRVPRWWLASTVARQLVAEDELVPANTATTKEWDMFATMGWRREPAVVKHGGGVKTSIGTRCVRQWHQRRRGARHSVCGGAILVRVPKGNPAT